MKKAKRGSNRDATDWTSISLTEDEKQELNEYRPDNEKWGEFLIREITTDRESIHEQEEKKLIKLEQIEQTLNKIQSEFEAKGSTNKDQVEQMSNVDADNLEPLLNEIRKIMEISEQTRNKADQIEKTLNELRSP